MFNKLDFSYSQNLKNLIFLWLFFKKAFLFKKEFFKVNYLIKKLGERKN